jgi:hypothetical protein
MQLTKPLQTLVRRLLASIGLFATRYVHHSHYRPDIHGLRAIVALTVMLFHYNPAWLLGGFFANAPFFEGILIYFDEHHLNEEGAKRYAAVARSAFKIIMN